jgi:hypothetical protein
MKITKAKLKQIIKEELEVVLTNEEVEEMFGEEVRAQVEAMESKEITKEAIMEEMQSDPALLGAIDKLIDSIEGLDVSIDFLSAAFTGESAFSIVSGQRTRGRAYRPKAVRPAAPMDEDLDERKLSKGEEKEKEKVIKGMKKSKSDFKKRYGDDAESVMYATATKIAKDKK